MKNRRTTKSAFTHFIIGIQLAGSVEAQLKKALTIAVSVQANRMKRKADNLDDSASPPEKLQRVTHEKSLCGSCHKDVARLRKQMIQCDDCDQWHHYVCVGVRASNAELVDFVCPGKCHGQ